MVGLDLQWVIWWLANVGPECLAPPVADLLDPPTGGPRRGRPYPQAVGVEAVWLVACLANQLVQVVAAG